MTDFANFKKRNKTGLHIERDKLEDDIEIQKLDRILVIGLLMLLLLMPLLVGMRVIEFTSPLVTGTKMDTGLKTDFFTYYKYIVLLFGTFILALIFLYKVFMLGYQIPKSKINIFLGILLITIMLSSTFSEYKTLALYGMFDRHEGTITYICYLILLFIAININFSSRQLLSNIYILIPFIIVNTILGLISFFGIDILSTELGKKLLSIGIPEGVKVAEGSKLASTLGNGNYVSGVSSMLLVIFTVLAIIEKEIKKQIIFIISSILSFVLMLTSFASSGFVTVVLFLPLFVVGVFKTKNKKKYIGSSVIIFILFATIFIPMANYQPRVWDETVGFFFKNNPFTKEKVGINISASLNEEVVERNVFNNRIERTAFAEENINYSFPELPEAGVAAGTGRAYIWAKSLELIGVKPFLGYGLDTFSYHFDQNDPQKHANLAEGYSVVVDKPHNIFINIAYGSGLISLFAFLGLVSFILFNTIKKRTQLNPYLIALIFGILAYLIQGLFNDSVIGTSILFWVFLGIAGSSIIARKDLGGKTQ